MERTEARKPAEYDIRYYFTQEELLEMLKIAIGKAGYELEGKVSLSGLNRPSVPDEEACLVILEERLV